VSTWLPPAKLAEKDSLLIKLINFE
jgi:hypothetical protein